MKNLELFANATKDFIQNCLENKLEMTFSHLKREHAKHVKYDIYEVITHYIIVKFKMNNEIIVQFQHGEIVYK